MANELTRTGYGQVEPNHLSAQRTGQIYAQLPLGDDIHVAVDGVIGTTDGVENGQFVKYDYATGECNLSGPGEWMLVYNEEKLYEVGQTRADFVMLDSDAVDGVVVPRVYKTNVGDIYTTNMVTIGDAGVTVVGKILGVSPTTGVLTGSLTATGPSAMRWQVVEVTTMPDGQEAVKIMRLPDSVEGS